LSARLKGVRLARLTPHTITTAARLREELRVTRNRWFAFDREESTDGLQCIATPVLDQGGECVAAISASVPAVRLGPERMPEVLARVCEAARRLSRSMGYRGAYPGALAADRERLGELLKGVGGPPPRRPPVLGRR
jgi:DNA-binding IclR family transcriptional regulator